MRLPRFFFCPCGCGGSKWAYWKRKHIAKKRMRAARRSRESILRTKCPDE